MRCFWFFLPYFTLGQDSPCVNAGFNDALPPDAADLDNDQDLTEQTPLDYSGIVERISDFTVDLGAHERPVQ